MNEAVEISQKRTYWLVCGQRADGMWFLHGAFRETQAEAERRLRWLRQWHPDAFLVQTTMWRCPERSNEPPLPVRTSRPEPQTKPTAKPKLQLV